MSDREIVGFLATVPLFEGWAEADLTELANVARRRTPREGETLWRQGDDAREMAVVVEGRLAATLRGAGDRAREIGLAGPRGCGRRNRTARWRRPLHDRGSHPGRHAADSRQAGHRGAARQWASGSVQFEAATRTGLRGAAPQSAATPRRHNSSRAWTPRGTPRCRCPPTFRSAGRLIARMSAAWRASTNSILPRFGDS